MNQQTKILQSVAVSMSNFGTPLLLDERDWEEGEKMAAAGLLKKHEPIFKSFSYSLTEEGISAYYLAFPEHAPQPAVKIWGDKPPKTHAARVSFIHKQCPKPLEAAYWLDVTNEKGETESWTLCESELDKKLEELKYDRYEDADRISFGREDSSELMPTCEISGKLTDGSSSSEPDAMAYAVSGFAWRRESGFQMEERDWQEARGFLEALHYADEPEPKKLARLIAQSCFIEPKIVNNTGLINPGGGGQSEYGQLIALFDFMSADASTNKNKEEDLPPMQERPRG